MQANKGVELGEILVRVAPKKPNNFDML